MSDEVEIVIDDERCIGSGTCELLYPDRFRVDDDTAIATLVEAPFVLPRDDAEALIDRCPSGALGPAVTRDGAES